MTLSLWELAVKGGWIMIVLAFLSFIAIYIFVERFIAIKKASKYESKFMENIRAYILDGKLDNALALCKANDNPFSRMIEKGIQRIGRPLNDINAAIENVGQLEIENLKKGLPFLGTIAGAAPMIGFLGTVTGMVRAFYNMANAGNNLDITMLAGGIYEAMVTTIGGLIVGIVAYLAYNYLVSQIERLVYMLQATATEFMDLLNEPIK
ncbi:MAG: MotA/TolQ/ExbB proton channel family protein [Bacteroidales bacterium]|nr:MotA/TolQ/ExbB proton channel family protein [Bacteroidales bacterium]